MSEPLPVPVSLAILKTEARQMMSMCFWQSRSYWSSYPTAKRKNSSDVVVRVACSQTVDWIYLNFCKYHAESVAIFQGLPLYERFFDLIKLNRYQSFRVWGIDSKHFAPVVSRLNNYADVELEFIISSTQKVSSTQKGLVIPELFQPLNFTFYPRGKAC